jgi:hypothetical protein
VIVRERSTETGSTPTRQKGRRRSGQPRQGFDEIDPTPQAGHLKDPELENQAKEIDDALKKGGDKETQADHPGQSKVRGIDTVLSVGVLKEGRMGTVEVSHSPYCSSTTHFMGF